MKLVYLMLAIVVVAVSLAPAMAQSEKETPDYVKPTDLDESQCREREVKTLYAGLDPALSLEDKLRAESDSRMFQRLEELHQTC